MRKFIFGDNARKIGEQIAADRIADTSSSVPLTAEQLKEIDERMGKVMAVYSAIRKSSAVDSLIARTPISI